MLVLCQDGNLNCLMGGITVIYNLQMVSGDRDEKSFLMMQPVKAIQPIVVLGLPF